MSRSNSHTPETSLRLGDNSTPALAKTFAFLLNSQYLPLLVGFGVVSEVEEFFGWLVSLAGVRAPVP